MPQSVHEGPHTASDAQILDVRVNRLEQLFNAIDPAPFRGRALDPDAEAYLVGRAQEASRRKQLALRVYLSREPANGQAQASLREAVGVHFEGRARAKHRQIRRLLRNGRISLLIGLLFLGAAILAESFIIGIFGLERYGRVLAESLIIGGWVALWRPLGIFLYDWWPLLGEARLYQRMSAMPVELLALASPPHPNPPV